MEDFTSSFKNKKFKRGTWEIIEHHRLYAELLGKELGYVNMDDWYKITTSIIIKNNGGSLLKKYYNNSAIEYLRKIFPEHKWVEWKFSKVTRNFWNKIENHILYAEWLGKELGYVNIDDWYNITTSIISKNYGGSPLVLHYNSSPIKFLRKVFPEYIWVEWKLSVTTNGFWNNIENHKHYIDWLGNELGYKTLEDWYNITYDLIYTNGGSVLLSKFYSNSPLEILKKIYPQFKWLGWKFSSAPNNFWDNIENVKEYGYWLGKELGYTKLDDWYKINTIVIKNMYGGGILTYYKLIDFIRIVFPYTEWFEWKFDMTSNGFWKNTENHKKYLHWLGNKLGYSFPNDWYKINKYIIEENYGSGLLSNYYNHSPCKLITSVYSTINWDVSKFKKNYSIGQIQWLEYMKISTPDICHILNSKNGEFKIPYSNYKADGFSLINNEIYEYNGDFWHGNPKIYNEFDINLRTNTTFGELYKKTIKKQEFINNSGYKYYSIWESDWRKAIRILSILQKKIKILYNKNIIQ